MLFPHPPYVGLEAPDVRTYATEDPRAFLADYPAASPRAGGRRRPAGARLHGASPYDFRPFAGAPTQNAWPQCGAWAKADFADGGATLEVDLTSALTTVGQWRVRFAPGGGTGELELTGEVLLQQGQPSAPGALTVVRRRDRTSRATPRCPRDDSAYTPPA